MSKSRLEKFLYALYSLDSSDLPNPLSRIEELYKCLVTGDEAPTFEPLSRVEKYLMAILGSYDAELLPNPLSRVEVLLYKLATGDDNLDDFKSFLSEHEELLAEIIRNGGVGGNIDIEYVLYTLSTGYSTLYNTAEKPVKSAILKGNTLVNLSNYKNLECVPNMQFSLTKPNLISGNKTYILIFTHTGANGDTFAFQEYKAELGWIINHQVTLVSNTPKQYYIFTTKENTGLMKIQSTSENNYTLNNLMVLEYQNGMENWDIPYFEGMQSVKMPVLTTTGKNLFDGKLEFGDIDSTTGEPVNHPGRSRSKNFIKVIPSNSYFMYSDLPIDLTNFGVYIYQYDSNRNYIGLISVGEKNNVNLLNQTFTVDDDCHFIKIRTTVVSTLNFDIGVMSDGKNYEPYKSNILTTSEEVELRGIGEVQDELDLLTGEVTERIGNLQPIQLTFGSPLAINSNTVSYSLGIISDIKPNQKNTILSNALPQNNATTVISENEGFYTDSRSTLVLVINKSRLTTLDKDGLLKWLTDTSCEIIYLKSSESIKTVDLTVVDQDGNDTKLSTFNDITHVTLSSEGLIPEAELEVATKNEEVLNTMSLEMDDISTAQTTLEETSNTQSENIDATMIATTEIYEGLL